MSDGITAEIGLLGFSKKTIIVTRAPRGANEKNQDWCRNVARSGKKHPMATTVLATKDLKDLID